MGKTPIAAATMCYRSPPLLSKWISHYGGMLGHRNLFIISHGRCDEQEALATGCNYLTIPRSEFTPNIARLKSNILRDFSSFLLNSYSAVVCGDVDELIVVHPDIRIDFETYVDSLPANSIVAPVGLNIVPRLNYYEMERPAAIGTPLLRQCNRVSLASNFCKPSIVKRTPRFAPGNHWLIKDKFSLDPNIVLFHTKYLALNGLSFYEKMADDVRAHANKTGTLKHELWVKGVDGLRMIVGKLEHCDDQRVADPKDEALQLAFGPVSDGNEDKRVVGPRLGDPFKLSENWLDLV